MRFKAARFVLSCFLLALLSPIAHGQTWVLSGTVTDINSVGIVNADLDLINATSGIEVLTLSGDVTMADGVFSTTITSAIPSGLYNLIVRPPAGSLFFEKQVSNIFLSASTAIGNIQLDSGVLVEGRVIGDIGQGLEEVDLEFIDPMGVPFAASGDITDSQGEFAVLVPANTYDIEFRVTAGTPAGPWVPVMLRDFQLATSTDLGDIEFRLGYPVSGTVLGSTGLALANADIDIKSSLTGDSIHTPDDNTDLSGNFSVLVPDGDWLLQVDPPLGQSLVTLEIPISMASAPLAVGSLQLVSGLEVFGTVIDAMGTPVPEVDLDFVISSTQIEIPTSHDNAGPTGEFSVIVPAETYDIQFRPPFITGLAPLVVENVLVNSLTNMGNVSLSSGFALTGNVTSLGSPVEDVHVTLLDSATLLPVYVFGNSTDLLGDYGIRQISGTYDVVFTPPMGSGLDSYTEEDFVFNMDSVLNAVLVPSSSMGTVFTRGDANNDQQVNIADVIFMLAHLFSGGPAPSCDDSGDSNDDGSLDISDTILTLAFLFSGAADLPPPFLMPGIDPTPDALSCP